MDWTSFPVGYGILLNERYQFPMDMALVRMKLDLSRQLFVDNHMIAHMQGLTRETHATREHPANPVFAPYKHYPSHICPDPEHGFRLYYNSGGWPLHVAYSSDGVNWEMPELNVFDDLDRSAFPGGPNNVVSVGELHGPRSSMKTLRTNSCIFWGVTASRPLGIRRGCHLSGENANRWDNSKTDTLGWRSI